MLILTFFFIYLTSFSNVVSFKYFNALSTKKYLYAARVLYDVGFRNDSNKYPISRPHYLNRKSLPIPSSNSDKLHNFSSNNTSTFSNIHPRNISKTILYRAYPISRPHHENYLKRLNSKNITVRNFNLLSGFSDFDETMIQDLSDHPFFKHLINNNSNIRITGIKTFDDSFNDSDDDSDDDSHDIQQPISLAEAMQRNIFGTPTSFGVSPRGARPGNSGPQSENYQVIRDVDTNFSHVGGYQKIKDELFQCIDILTNYTKYSRFNVRVPKGVIFEGPPGNGKTLLAKGFAGEANINFISVSGSEFQEKYVGVGASRIRELFDLASNNLPCVIFIDEIDAVGRKRSGDGESSNSERDSTLNQLLTALDGFKNSTGIFLIGATNRVDLLDPALLRPGRIDKQIFISNPDYSTRLAIINIHIQGKPYNSSEISIENLVDLTQGFSGAQIENTLNEAMLHALRNNRVLMRMSDIDESINRLVAGWQPSDHQFTSDIIDHIAIHEMGHALVGILSKHHSKMTKVVINLSSPRTPGYTLFEPSSSNIHTREALFEHLAILLAGRIAEEVCFDVSVTTGAINDFEEAFKLAEKMVMFYGMGKNVIYPNSSEKYKEIIDNEVAQLIDSAYAYSVYILQHCKDLLIEGADILKKDKLLPCSQLDLLIDNKYPNIRNIK